MDTTLERILSLIPRKPNGDFAHGSKIKFANSIGLKSGNLISDWENGRSASYTDYVYKIAEVYNVSSAWLTGESDTKEKPATVNDDERELNEYLEYLRTRPECRMLMRTVKGATKAEVEENVRFIEALRKSKNQDD